MHFSEAGVLLMMLSVWAVAMSFTYVLVKLPAYCGCCGCIKRYCNCSCCCQK